jgi:hypothetical protein
MLAQNIDNARDTTRIGMDRADSVRLKDRRAIGSRNAESLLDIAIGLLQRKRSCPAADSDALAELTKLVALELCLQFGLTGENDLQELLPRRFEIQ